MGKFLSGSKGKKAKIVVTNAALRGVGNVGSAYIKNTVMKKITAIPAKYHGLVLAGLGIFGELYAPNPQLVAVAEGVTQQGILSAVGDLALPNEKSKFGLSGTMDITDAQIVGSTDAPGFDWATALAEANLAGEIPLEEVAGLQEDLSGIADKLS